MKRILIVDDDRDLLKYCQMKLSALGHAVLTASSADEALSLVKNDAFDLLIIDIMMPKKNGFALLAELKLLPEFRSSVLILTGKRSREDVLKARTLGANDYLFKPVKKELLLARVQAAVGKIAVKELITSIDISRPVKIAFEGVLAQLTLTGLTFLSPAHFTVHSSLQLEIALFAEMGITPPRLIVTDCMPIAEFNPQLKYRITAGFVELAPDSLAKIKFWMNRPALRKDIAA